jgi:hypothetical protein
VTRWAGPSDPKAWTGHVAIDLNGLVFGEVVVVNGHKFAVAKMEFATDGRVQHDPRPGHDFTDAVSELDLRLVHTPWKGCPAVDPAPEKAPVLQPWDADELCRRIVSGEVNQSGADRLLEYIRSLRERIGIAAAHQQRLLTELSWMHVHTERAAETPHAIGGPLSARNPEPWEAAVDDFRAAAIRMLDEPGWAPQEVAFMKACIKPITDLDKPRAKA